MFSNPSKTCCMLKAGCRKCGAFKKTMRLGVDCFAERAKLSILSRPRIAFCPGHETPTKVTGQKFLLPWPEARQHLTCHASIRNRTEAQAIPVYYIIMHHVSPGCLNSCTNLAHACDTDIKGLVQGATTIPGGREGPPISPQQVLQCPSWATDCSTGDLRTDNLGPHHFCDCGRNPEGATKLSQMMTKEVNLRIPGPLAQSKGRPKEKAFYGHQQWPGQPRCAK